MQVKEVEKYKLLDSRHFKYKLQNYKQGFNRSSKVCPSLIFFYWYLLIMSEYELWVNMNYEWVQIMGEYESWWNMKYGGIWIMGEYELWMNMNMVEYELLVNNNHDRIWIVGNMTYEGTLGWWIGLITLIFGTHLKKIKHTPKNTKSMIFIHQYEYVLSKCIKNPQNYGQKCT